VIAGLVLAAGAGTRFGGRKQLADLDGRPLLEHALEAMASAPVEPTCTAPSRSNATSGTRARRRRCASG
jgi:CTP:molybdopterin cytidylyltransferase MocA